MKDPLTSRPPRWEQVALLCGAVAAVAAGCVVLRLSRYLLAGPSLHLYPPQVASCLPILFQAQAVIGLAFAAWMVCKAVAREEYVALSMEGVSIRSWSGRRALAWRDVAALRIDRGPVYRLAGADGRWLRVLPKRFGARAEEAMARLDEGLAPARERWRDALRGDGIRVGGSARRLLWSIPALLVLLNQVLIEGTLSLDKGGKPVTLAQVERVMLAGLGLVGMMAVWLLFLAWRASRRRLRLTWDSLSETIGTQVWAIPLAAVTRIELRRRAGEYSKSETARVCAGTVIIDLTDGLPDYALVLEHIVRSAPNAELVEVGKADAEPDWAAWLRRSFGGRWASPGGSPDELRAKDRARIVAVVLMVAGVFPTCLPVMLIWDWVSESRSAHQLASGNRSATAVVRFFSPRDDPRQAVCDYTYGGQRRVGFLDLPPAQLRRLHKGQVVRLICTGGDGRNSCYAPDYQGCPEPPPLGRLLLAVATMLVGITLIGMSARVVKLAGIRSF